MSWAEWKLLDQKLDRFVGMYRRLFIYENATFVVPFDCGITIRAVGKGGGGNYKKTSFEPYTGGGGGGYCKDYRTYKKGDIINITFTNGNCSVICQSQNLNLLANAGGTVVLNTSTSDITQSGGEGGTASGGNICNYKGGKGGNSSYDAGSQSKVTAGEDSLGCGGGGGTCYSANYSVYIKCGNGGNGGFSGGNGGTGYRDSWRDAEMDSGSGGNGGFCGGYAGNMFGNSSRNYILGNGGTGQHGIGGDAGIDYNTTTSTNLTSITSGKGGDGSLIAGKKSQSIKHSALLTTNSDGTVVGAYNFVGSPRNDNIGGGNGGVAACILTFGEDIDTY